MIKGFNIVACRNVKTGEWFLGDKGPEQAVQDIFVMLIILEPTTDQPERPHPIKHDSDSGSIPL
jgi:hypothetical protein